MVEKCTQKLVDEYNHMLTYDHMVDNVVLIVTGTLHERNVYELLENSHPLGLFERLYIKLVMLKAGVYALSLVMNASTSRTSRLFRTKGDGLAKMPKLYLRLTTKCMEQADRMTMLSTSPRFNSEQCKYLAHKLKVAVRRAQLFLEQIETWYSRFASTEAMIRSLDIFKLLFVLGKEVESFIQDCCKENWIQSAFFLTNVMEYISSIGFNLEFCSILFLNWMSLGAIRILTLTEVTSLSKSEAETVRVKARQDGIKVCRILEALVMSIESSSSEWRLATLLLERLRSQGLHSGADSRGFNQSGHSEILGLKQMGSLGKGTFGIVHKAMWLGFEVAKKTFHGPNNPNFLQEVSILGGLFHPNIVSLLWHTRDERNCYIIMELMDGDLYSLMQERMQKRKEERGCYDPPFTILESIDIMLQVAEGLLFLHEKKIVHRDLKSGNILVRCVDAHVDVTYLKAKVADFGLSRTKEFSMTYSDQTPNTGTSRWMAPEIIKIRKNDDEAELSEGDVQLKYPFKSDIYSFAMLCYEILTGDIPFSALSQKEVKEKVLDGSRPQLPHQCPDKLRSLIEACWSSEPSLRPYIGDICAGLRHLKCAHFMTSAWAKAPRCFSFDEIGRMTNKFKQNKILSGVHSWNKVYKGVMPSTGEMVAVKRLRDAGKTEISFIEFETRMKVLAKVRHINLVGYVGFCYEKGERILVFEYVANGTLAKCLFENAWNVNLTWLVRQNICLGVAKGMHYLHTLDVRRTIHRDITATDILLDKDLHPKIAYFNSALLTPDHRIDLAVHGGNSGCFASKHATLGQLSQKDDVYNFGVLLLEIVSGRRNIETKLAKDQIDLSGWALKLHSERRTKELIDSNFDLQPNEEIELVRIIKIAFLCMHPVAITRPDVALVLAMLEGNADAEITRLGLSMGALWMSPES